MTKKQSGCFFGNTV